MTEVHTTPFLIRMRVSLEEVPYEQNTRGNCIRFRGRTRVDVVNLALDIGEAIVKHDATCAYFTRGPEIVELASAIPCESRTPLRFNEYAELNTVFIEPRHTVYVDPRFCRAEETSGVLCTVNEGWRNATYECRFDNIGGYGELRLSISPDEQHPGMFIGQLNKVRENDRIHAAYFNRKTNPLYDSCNLQLSS